MTVIIASTPTSKKVINNQERLEAIFHTVDAIKSDLNKCSMRLQVVRQFSGISPFTSSTGSFIWTYGIIDEQLLKNAVQGQKSMKVALNEFFKKGRDILIYDLANQAWEMNKINSQLDSALVLNNQLQNDYPLNSMVVALKRSSTSFTQSSAC